jgi:hypothetical protein
MAPVDLQERKKNSPVSHNISSTFSKSGQVNRVCVCGLDAGPFPHSLRLHTLAHFVLELDTRNLKFKFLHRDEKGSFNWFKPEYGELVRF